MTFHNPDGFTINENGIIQNPGKFEAELIYVPYFYSIMLDGGSTETLYENDQPIDVFEIDDDDRAKFPGLLDDVYAVLLWTDDQGFCNSLEMTERELETFRAEPGEDGGPGEDDITTTDHEKFYQYGRPVIQRRRSCDTWQFYTPKPGALVGSGTWADLGVFGDDHKAALRAYMERVQYWPNCWFISDHGNAHLMDLSEGK